MFGLIYILFQPTYSGFKPVKIFIVPNKSILQLHLPFSEWFANQ